MPAKSFASSSTVKAELLAEPAAAARALQVADAEALPEVIARYLTALQWRGSHRAGEGFRTIMDVLQIDDAGWFFRTGPSGRIELRKTIKAVESGVRLRHPERHGRGHHQAHRPALPGGGLQDIVRSIADWTRALGKIPPTRMTTCRTHFGRGGAFTSKPVMDDVERLGHQFTMGARLPAVGGVLGGEYMKRRAGAGALRGARRPVAPRRAREPRSCFPTFRPRSR